MMDEPVVISPLKCKYCNAEAGETGPNYTTMPFHECSGQSAARIAALEAELAAERIRPSGKSLAYINTMLQAGRDVMAVIHGDGGHYREAHGDRKAADDAINIIYKLRADLYDARIELNRLRAGEMPGGWTAELESQIAARHAERDRREAAETLLRRGYTTAELVAHFARYKD